MDAFEQELAALESRKPQLPEVIYALRSGAESRQSVIPSVIIYGLSDLSARERDELAVVWRELPAAFKAQTLRALNEASEALFELNFREIAWMSLADRSGQARAAAIDLLWFDESPQTMREMMRLADDADAAVRESALTDLGRFLLLGEYGGISDDMADEAQQIAFRLHMDKRQPVAVRRRALEALANSSHPQVSDLIREAYANGSRELKIGAIFAMGRTCNSVWSDYALAELNSDDGVCVYEAIAACGQLGLKEAVPRISELTRSDDDDIQLAAIAALGEIGGRRALDILTELADETADEATADAVDEALDAAAFSFGLNAPTGMYDGA